MTVSGGGQNPTSVNGGGQASESVLVRIDSDVQPVWETEALPDWVVTWLIPMLSAGQKWPEASESGLSTLAHRYADLAGVAVDTTPDAGAAARVIVTGWASPATADFVSRAKVLYGHEGGLAGVAANAHAYGQQANDFAVETQYSKISINVAFWVTVVAIAIALIAAFFSAGTSTAIIGPYAAAARAAISRILVRLATLGGRSLTATRLARVTSLSGATGRSAISRLLASSLGRELVEEIGEEFFIDAATQYQQIRMGTRQEWDWKKSQAAIVGAGAGAVVGTRLAGPISRVTSTVPGFAGRALTTGATNMIASPAGSYIANGAVYGDWSQNPFTADALMGGFMGGAGRTGTISPFNPDVYSALTHPVSTLASANDAAARADAMRAAGDPGQGTGGNPANPSGGGPTPEGGPVRTGEAARTAAPATTGTTTRPAGSPTADRTSAAPDAPTTRRGSSAPAQTAERAQPEPRTEEPAQTTATPDPATSDPHRPRTASAPSTDSTPQNPTDPTTDTPRNQTATSTTPDQDTTADQNPTGTNASADQNPTQTAPDQNATTADATADQNPATAAANATAPEQSLDPANGTPDPAPEQDLSTAEQTAGNPGTADQQTDGDARLTAEPATQAEGTTTTASQGTPVHPDGTTPTTVQPSTPATDRPSGPEAGVYPQSKPGTVTSRPVADTRYVTDGRQGADVTLDGVRAATAELLTEYFRDGSVTGWTWSQDGTLAVHTTADGTQHFRPVIGGVSSRLMAETRVRQSSSATNPHEVHFNPRIADDQIARVWLHEITDTLQQLRSDGRRGILRRRAETRQDHCVTARLNELEMLADKWRQADTMPQKRLLALDIDGVNRELRDRGHPAPLPPWAPTQSTRGRHAPPVPQGPPSATEIQALIDTLTRAEQDLRAQAKAKKDSAAEAKTAASEAGKEARKALRQHDSGRLTRAGKLNKERDKHRATYRRHRQSEQAYESARKQAAAARSSYEKLLTDRQRPPSANRRGQPTVPKYVRDREEVTQRQHQRYLEALTKALPPVSAASTAMPTGGLAHLSRLTATVNEILESNGAGHRFTSDELERALRADFHKAVSPDGVMLRVGRGPTAAEVRVRLSLSDLAEVLDAGVKASEMMVGHFFQASRTVSATETSSAGISANVNTAALAQALPEGEWYQTVAQLVRFGVGGGRTRSSTGGAGMFAQGGSVADNRSESLLFDAAASWTVEVRTGKAAGWRDTTVVDSGAAGDPASQRLWFSHSYTDQPPRKVERINKNERDAKLPNLVVHEMTGLEEAFDQVAEELGGDFAKVGTVSRESLHAFIADELPHRLRDAEVPPDRQADPTAGIERVFTRNGKPYAKVRAVTQIVLEESKPLGGPTSDEWEEEVLVDFVAAPGGASASGSLNASLSLGLEHQLTLSDGSTPALGPEGKGSKAASRSYSATANQQAIHPSVHRKTSHKQAYRLVHKTTFVVEKFNMHLNRSSSRESVEKKVSGTVTASMRESAAYRYGLPVDSAALTSRNGRPLLDAEGRQVLRGDPQPGPPPGREEKLPEWLGDGPGRMRGSGPALVQDIDGLDQVREQVLEQLREHGLIPKIENGVPKYAGNELARAAQILNEQEVREQLSEHRIRSAYDTIAQDGIVLDLVKHGLNRVPQHFAMHIRLTQDFTAADYVGYTDSETVVNLEIGSDTSARAVSRTSSWGAGAALGLGESPDEGENGSSQKYNRGWGRNWNRTVGSSSGGTVNVVTLLESTGPVAIFSLKHELEVQLLRNGEPVSSAVTASGSARLLFAADLLPQDTATAPALPPAPIGKIPDELRSRMRLLHMDVPEILTAAREVAPSAMRPGSPAWQKIRAVLSARNLVSHAKLLAYPLLTSVAVRPDGIPVRSSLSVSGELGDASVVGIVDHVSGDILFGLGSAGVSWGGSTGNAHENSKSFGAVTDGGTASDGGTVSGPSRSAGTSHSTSILDIWGSEELSIHTGRHYIVRASVDLSLAGSESTAGPLLSEGRQLPGPGGPASARGTALFAVPEFQALLTYSQGKLDLPGHLVGDAIERLLNGSLNLDRTLAVPLVQRYVTDMTRAKAAGEDVSYARRHTPKALTDKLRTLIDPGAPDAAQPASTSKRVTARERAQLLTETLTRGKELIERAKNVVLAPSYDRAVSLGATESITLTDGEGRPVQVQDAVMGTVRDGVADLVDQNPTLEEEIAVDFSEDAVRIHAVDMWSRNGYEKSYHVQNGSVAEEVTVNVRLEYRAPGDSRKGTLLWTDLESGSILQHYRYGDRSHSESGNGSWGFGLQLSENDDGDGGASGVSTDRNRSYAGSSIQQGTRVQRTGRFVGTAQVEQEMRFVTEVTRRPVHAGAVRRGPVGRFRHGPVLAARSTYDAVVVRRIPRDMTRPAHPDEKDGLSPAEQGLEVSMTPDHRLAELRPGFFTDALWDDPGKPSLFEAVYDQVARMMGAKTAEERRSELLRRLSTSAMLTAFERMTGPEGHVERVASLRFRKQGLRITLRARLSDLTLLTGPFEGEKGQVDRMADGQNVTVSRGRVLPVGVGLDLSEGTSGLGAGQKVGEQASESVTDHHAARRERSDFERGELITVRFRVDYDAIFEHVARRRNRSESPVGDPVHLPGMAGGTVDVTLLRSELDELMSRMERGVRLALPSEPGTQSFAFDPDQRAAALRKRSENPGQAGQVRRKPVQLLRDALLEARERAMPARVVVREDGVVHRYLAMPDGTLLNDRPDGEDTNPFTPAAWLRSEKPDGGFAQAFTTLPSAVLDAVEETDLDLRAVYMNSEVDGTFTEQVVAALAERGLTVPEQQPAWRPAEEVSQTSQAPAQKGSTAQGFSGGGAPSRALSDTIFDRAARPAGDPDLTLAEVRGTDLLSGGTWTSGETLTVRSPGVPDQHVRVLVEDPGPGLNAVTEPRAGTPEDPHVMRLSPRIHPDVVSSVVTHERAHVAQFAAAAAAGAPQGVVRPSAREGDDVCLLPRLAEHEHLSRKWKLATDPDVRSNLADAIDAVAADVGRRGHERPAPPWGSGSRTAAPESSNRIDLLLNGGGTATRTPSGARPSLPEAAAAAAVRRAAALMSADVQVSGPGVLDIQVPGHPPISVEVRPAGPRRPARVPAQGGSPEQGGTTEHGRASAQDRSAERTVTYQVDGRLTIGANERAAAATAARAIALAREAADQADQAGQAGRTDAGQAAPADQAGQTGRTDAGQAAPAAELAAVAELNEAVRQVRSATAAQRLGRLGMLFDLVTAHPEAVRLLPAPVAAELATLTGGERPRDLAAHLHRIRTLANGTGWYPPERECTCPEGEPCTCGPASGISRESADPVRA